MLNSCNTVSFVKIFVPIFNFLQKDKTQTLGGVTSYVLLIKMLLHYVSQEIPFISFILANSDTSDRENVGFNDRLKAEKAKYISG